MPRITEGFYSGKHFLTALSISAIYLMISYFLIGYKPDQLGMVILCNLLYFASSISRKYVTAFSIFLVYWIIFDYMKAFPNYRYNAVHIESLYNAEKHLFGFFHKGVKVTPNEYFQLNATSFLDVISGIFYLCWVPVPLLFATYLFFTDKNLFFHFSLTFLLVNLLGFVVYYGYPAAPPWYVQEHGFKFLPHTAGNPAGLIRFDNYFQAEIFTSLYKKSSNVFAAMPSLHSSYPLIVFYYSLKTRLPAGIRLLLFSVMAGIWFAAVYSSHHYILDVAAGILCGILGILLFNYLLSRSWMRNFVTRMVAATT